MGTRVGDARLLAPMLACMLVTGAVSAQTWPHSVVLGVAPNGRGLPPGSAGAIDSKRYWADPVTQAIRRSNLDGSSVEDIATGLRQPYGLSFDSATNALLWTSSGDEVVQRLSLEGASPQVLPCEFEDPYTIQVTSELGRRAYALDGADVVEVTQSADGTSETRAVLLTLTAVERVHGLALDEQAGLLYLGDDSGQMTRRLRLADHAVEPLVYVEESFPLAPGTGRDGLPIEELLP